MSPSEGSDRVAALAATGYISRTGTPDPYAMRNWPAKYQEISLVYGREHEGF